MELGEIGNFPGEGEFIYKRTKFCDGVYRVDLVAKTPLVRCRDCVRVEYCKFFSSRPDKPDGFCKWGEPREEVGE